MMAKRYQKIIVGAIFSPFDFFLFFSSVLPAKMKPLHLNQQ